MKRIHLFTLSRMALMMAMSAAPVLAQAPGGGQPQMVELVGSWTEVNDEERLVRIDPKEALALLSAPAVEDAD